MAETQWLIILDDDYWSQEKIVTKKNQWFALIFICGNTTIVCTCTYKYLKEIGG